MKRALLFLLFATLLIEGAAAHASLVRTEPHAGAVVARAPTRVVMDFTEPLDAPVSSAHVTSANGSRVDVPGSQRIQGTRLTLDLVPGLGNGTYVVTYHVTSTVDGHPTHSAWGYGVGNATPPTLPPPPSYPPLPWLAGLAKAGMYIGMALLWGDLAVRAWVARPLKGQPVTLTPWPARIGALLVLLATAAFVVHEGRTIGTGVRAYLLHTEIGRLIRWRLVLGALLLVALLLPRRRGASAATVALAALSFLHAASSHTAALSPNRYAGALLDALHLLPALAWSGGLLLLFLLLRRLWATLPMRDDLLAAVSVRFSQLAIACVILVTATGIAMVLVMAGGQPDRILPLIRTPYGNMLLYKVFLALLMVGLGGINQVFFVRRFQRGYTIAERPLFLANVRREFINGALVLSIAGLLTNLSPGVF